MLKHLLDGENTLNKYPLYMYLPTSQNTSLINIFLQVLVPVLIINATLGIMQYAITLSDNVQARALTLERG